MLWNGEFFYFWFIIERGQNCLKSDTYLIVFYFPDTALRFLSFFSQWPYEVCLSFLSLLEKPSFKDGKEQNLPRSYRPNSEWWIPIQTKLFLTLIPVYVLWYTNREEHWKLYEKAITYVCIIDSDFLSP